MGSRVRLQLRGKHEDGEHVRLADFITQLSALRLALINTERLISHRDRPTLYYRVVDLSHASPATVVLEATPFRHVNVDLSHEVTSKFFSGLHQIQETGEISPEFDRPILESYKALCSTLYRNTPGITLTNGQYRVEITPQLAARLEILLGTDSMEEGAVDGHLEAINLHNQANKFYIFPSAYPAKIVCHFTEAMTADAIAAIKRYVRVTGRVKYKKRSFFPQEIEVATMEVHSPASELPTLGSLRGIAPDATPKDLDSVSFIRSLRNG